MVGFKLIHVSKGPFWNILKCLQGRSVVRDLSYPSDILQVSDECRWPDAHLVPRHLLMLCRATVLLKWKSTQLNILILWWLYLTKVHDYSKFLRSYQIKVKIKQWKSMFYQIWTWENFHLSNTQAWVRNSTPPQFIYEGCSLRHTVETLYSTIYYSKYFIELNFDKSTQYVALWTHKRHPIPRPFGRAMECLLWVFQQKLTVL